MEELSIYDCQFVYIKGEDNTMADVLSRYPENTEMVKDYSTADKKARHLWYVASSVNHVVVNSRKGLSDVWTAVAALRTVEANNDGCASKIELDKEMIVKMQAAYLNDAWCQKLLSALKGMPEIRVKDRLWFIGDRLVVPSGCDMREQIFRLAHNTLGHFGFYKTYESLRHSYFLAKYAKRS